MENGAGEAIKRELIVTVTTKLPLSNIKFENNESVLDQVCAIFHSKRDCLQIRVNDQPIGVSDLDKYLSEAKKIELVLEDGNGISEKKETQERPQSLVRSQSAMTGLPNLGNTCYLNATLQCLCRCEPIRNLFYDDDILLGKEELTLSPSIREAIMRLFQSEKLKLRETIVSLKKAIDAKYAQFSGWGQHDADSLLRALVEGVHNELKSAPPPTPPELMRSSSNPDSGLSLQQMAETALQRQAQRGTSPIVRLLYVAQFTTISCKDKDCPHRSVSFGLSPILSLPIVGLKESFPVQVVPVFVSLVEQQPDFVAVEIEVTVATTVQQVKDLILRQLTEAKRHRKEYIANFHIGAVDRLANDDTLRPLNVVNATSTASEDERSTPIGNVLLDKPCLVAWQLKFPVPTQVSGDAQVGYVDVVFGENVQYRGSSKLQAFPFSLPLRLGFPRPPTLESVAEKVQQLLKHRFKHRGLFGSKPVFQLWDESDQGLTVLSRVRSGQRVLVLLDSKDSAVTAAFQSATTLAGSGQAQAVRDVVARAARTVREEQVEVAAPRLEQLLSRYLAPKELSGQCASCQKEGCLQTCLRVWAPPPVMILSLQRFQLDAATRALKKVNHQVFCTQELDVPYGETDADGVQNRKAKYELCGVIEHYGQTNSGHYVAICRGVDRKWYRLNDLEVTEVSGRPFNPAFVYILFYVLRGK